VIMSKSSKLLIIISNWGSFAQEVFPDDWPEDTTWDDRAASPAQRNRVTFMRCDQLSHRLLFLIK
jgi:hypothetical protein